MTYYDEDIMNAEIEAELRSGWVSAGFNPGDAYAYAYYEQHGWPTYEDDGAQCEHGMSASLCVGPSHYPLDM